MSYRIEMSVEDLRLEYVTRGKSAAECARIFNTSTQTVLRRLSAYGIPIVKERQFGGRTKTGNWPLLADKSWLEKQLKEKSMAQIAREHGTTSGNVSDFVKRHGLRPSHYMYQDAYKDGIKKAKRTGNLGAAASNWKGGRFRTGGGHIYSYAPEHPLANKDGYVMEHRLVVEKTIGRFLTRTEVVHHKNGIKDDNRPENLQVMTIAEHRKEHMDAHRKLHEAMERIAYLESLLKENSVAFH